MRVLIAGGSGFIGKALAAHLQHHAYKLSLLTRQKNYHALEFEQCINWEQLHQLNADDFDAIINLCGYNIGKKRWSDAVKQQLITSRIKPVHQLIEFIGNRNTRLINASAIAYYPFSKERQTESQHLPRQPQALFSHSLVSQWEASLSQLGSNQACALRFGIVLGKQGGMLKKVLPAARLGLNPILGDGRQLMSWIHIEDACRAIQFILEKPIHAQAVNLSTPYPTSNHQFTQSLAQSLHRPQFLRLPAFWVRLLFAEMGEELMLTSHNIHPEVLLNHGFKFQYPNIKQALEAIFPLKH